MSELIKAGQRFRFKEDMAAVLFTNPFGGLQDWCIPAIHRPYDPKLYGEEIVIPTGTVFTARDAYEAILGGHCVQAQTDFSAANGREFNFFQFKQRSHWQDQLDENDIKFIKTEIEILPDPE